MLENIVPEFLKRHIGDIRILIGVIRRIATKRLLNVLRKSYDHVAKVSVLRYVVDSF